MLFHAVLSIFSLYFFLCLFLSFSLHSVALPHFSSFNLLLLLSLLLFLGYCDNFSFGLCHEFGRHQSFVFRFSLLRYCWCGVLCSSSFNFSNAAFTVFIHLFFSSFIFIISTYEFFFRSIFNDHDFFISLCAL